MNTWSEAVARFMSIGHPENLKTSPTIPHSQIRALCRTLIDGEWNELRNAIADCDIVEVGDGVADVIYVALYIAHCHGLPIDQIMQAVVDTNLAKVASPAGIFRDPDTNKILKPPGWVPPDVAGIIAEYVPYVRLNCPWCGVRHFDRDEWATRVHRTHLCVPEQGGCGKLWTLNELVFGI